MAQIYKFPTINDNISDFCRLFKVYQEILMIDDAVEIDFSRCNFLRPNAVAFLGGFARAMESGSKPLLFNWETLQDDVQANLAQNGFLNKIGGWTSPWRGNSIPYREDKILNKDSIVDYLKTKCLQRGWINISPLLTNRITGNLLEIYLNAFEHSQSYPGVFTCGQHYPNNKQLTLSVVDFGVGIPHNVRQFSKRLGNNPDIKSEHAIKWAFKSGTTTAPDGPGRGVGLDILKNFIKANDGSLVLFSHDAYVKISKDTEEYVSHNCNFHGTVLHMTLQCDGNRYVLSEELEQTDLF